MNTFSLFVKNYHYIFAGVFGIIPALLWLWFWLKEDIHPEPTKLLIFTFLGGMLSVFIAVPVQQLIQSLLGGPRALTDNYVILFLLWAAIEELLKWGAAWVGGIHTTSDDEAVDPLIYMIVAALGFAAMENTLFLVDPLITGNLGNALITDNLRFIGAALLHLISSASLGVFLALSFRKSRTLKRWYAVAGCMLAITLHWLFNLFIIQGAESGMFIIFGCVWAAIIILMFLFERVKAEQIQ